MKRLSIIVLLLALNCFAVQYVAVLETIGASTKVNRDERLILTDELRRIAVENLPSYMGYTIMTRENINAMLPPGKSVEDCEGVCLVETGKNISADYVVQARIGSFGKSLSVTVELYETASGKLMSSVIGRGKDVEALLTVIENKTPAMFSVIKSVQNFIDGDEGFSGFQQNAVYNMDGNRQFLVSVVSEPVGAMVSVDGRPKCKSTPCNVQLVGGNHTFSFAFDMYLDKDTIVDVRRNEQNVSVWMKPNFGTLELVPQIGAYGNVSELSVIVDNINQNVGKLRLSVGKHHVKISHRCYEPMSFDVSVKNGSELRFERALQPAMGGLSLTAEGKNGPISIPVFVDGKKVGKTPFYETVPICAKVEVGNDTKDSLPVKLKYRETVDFVYKGPVLEKLIDDDGNVYRTVKIGQQIWMAENLNVETEESWCYENKPANCKKYGRLYSWSAAMEACPSGWHLPNKGEFEVLFEFVGGMSFAGTKLKSKSDWGNGLDNYFFAALPAGCRISAGDNFKFEGDRAYFWSSTKKYSGGVYRMLLTYGYESANFYDDGDKNFGFSVRCVKD